MKARHLLFCGILSMVVASSAEGQDSGSPSAPTEPSELVPTVVPGDGREFPLSHRSRRELALENLLDNAECEFNFADLTIAQVINGLEEIHGIEIMLETSAQEGDLPSETPINFHMSKVPLRTGLTALLKEKNATLRIKDNVLQIISFDVSRDPEYFRTRHYDCNLLLNLLVDAEQMVPQKWPVNRLRGAFGPGGFGGANGGPAGGGVFQIAENQTKSDSPTANLVAPGSVQVASPPTEYVDVSPMRQASNLLIDTIVEHVAADEWANTGQGDGVITIAGNILTVSQSEEALSQIKTFLQDLEQLLAARAARK